jgi:hypothetical protein
MRRFNNYFHDDGSPITLKELRDYIDRGLESGAFREYDQLSLDNGKVNYMVQGCLRRGSRPKLLHLSIVDPSILVDDDDS